MITRANLDVDTLREAIRAVYTDVAACPMRGFHFLAGRVLADRLGHPAKRVKRLPAAAGFTDIALSDRCYDTFADAPQASIAAEFGTKGVDIRAVKPAAVKKVSQGTPVWSDRSRAKRGACHRPSIANAAASTMTPTLDTWLPSRLRFARGLLDTRA